MFSPIALETVRRIAAKNKLANLTTILSECRTELSDSSIDVVLLCDVFHRLTNPDCVLEELRRVLKANGILSFSDHHMKENQIVSDLTKNELFRLFRKGEKTYGFSKTK
jgi:ubiquinone/menaquinone biosynthesis C-methylase UbiE